VLSLLLAAGLTAHWQLVFDILRHGTDEDKAAETQRLKDQRFDIMVIGVARRLCTESESTSLVQATRGSALPANASILIKAVKWVMAQLPVSEGELQAALRQLKEHREARREARGAAAASTSSAAPAPAPASASAPSAEGAPASAPSAEDDAEYSDDDGSDEDDDPEQHEALLMTLQGEVTSGQAVAAHTRARGYPSAGGGAGAAAGADADSPLLFAKCKCNSGMAASHASSSSSAAAAAAAASMMTSAFAGGRVLLSYYTCLALQSNGFDHPRPLSGVDTSVVGASGAHVFWWRRTPKSGV
jgi:hypothetical protein